MKGAAALHAREFTGRVLLLTGTACVCALVAHAVLPGRVAWNYPWSRDVELRAASQNVTLVSLAETRKIVDEGTHLVFDARPKAQFIKGHLPEAYSVPQADATGALQKVQALLTPKQPLLVYCNEQGCDEGLLLCLRLREHGYANAVLYLEGYKQWVAAGLPVERGE